MQNDNKVQSVWADLRSTSRRYRIWITINLIGAGIDWGFQTWLAMQPSAHDVVDVVEILFRWALWMGPIFVAFAFADLIWLRVLWIRARKGESLWGIGLWVGVVMCWTIALLRFQIGYRAIEVVVSQLLHAILR